jgi:hypothetical protein
MLLLVCVGLSIWKAPSFPSFLQVAFANYGGALLILLGIVWVITVTDRWIKRVCEGH